jgi:hypothetical protein
MAEYCFDVQLYDTEGGMVGYQISQEFVDDNGETEWQLLESGEAATMPDAAILASNSINRLFTV